MLQPEGGAMNTDCRGNFEWLSLPTVIINNVADVVLKLGIYKKHPHLLRSQDSSVNAVTPLGAEWKQGSISIRKRNFSSLHSVKTGS
jgi:hypothetical protein